MTVFHFGTNDGTVPYCFAAGLWPAPAASPRCVQPGTPLFEGDTVCPGCLHVYKQVRGHGYEAPVLRPIRGGPSCTAGPP